MDGNETSQRLSGLCTGNGMTAPIDGTPRVKLPWLDHGEEDWMEDDTL